MKPKASKAPKAQKVAGDGEAKKRKAKAAKGWGEMDGDIPSIP